MFTYKRIQKPTLFPHYTINELIEYPTAILDDSDYEEDEVV